MTTPIALLGNFDAADEARWLDALRHAAPEERIEPARTIDRPDEVEVAIVANCNPDALLRFRSLQWLQSLWAGVERLLAEPRIAHLPIVRLRDPELARTMGEAVLAWTLYLHREMPAYRSQQGASLWRPLHYRRPENRTVGVLGAGLLGTVAATRLRDAGFRVCTWSRSAPSEPIAPIAPIAPSAPSASPYPSVPRNVSIEHFHGARDLFAMLAQTDVLVALLPLTASTRGLIDARALAALPDGASLINFGRGPLVVTSDLIAALDRGRLRHAVLDVFDEEPLPATSPLWWHPSVTVLPHVSAETDPATASAIAAANLRHWRKTGEVPGAVDRGRGY